MISNIPRQSVLERGNWRVYVNPRPYDWQVEVWLTVQDGVQLSNATIKDGQIELKTVKEGSKEGHNPFLIVPSDVWQILVDAMTQTTPPTKKERIEGELEATLFHLQDLRSLLKLPMIIKKEEHDRF